MTPKIPHHRCTEGHISSPIFDIFWGYVDLDYQEHVVKNNRNGAGVLALCSVNEAHHKLCVLREREYSERLAL